MSAAADKVAVLAADIEAVFEQAISDHMHRGSARPESDIRRINEARDAVAELIKAVNYLDREGFLDAIDKRAKSIGKTHHLCISITTGTARVRAALAALKDRRHG